MSILVITGGQEFAREVYATERRGYWSQAFPLMLEKHGYLGCEIAGPEALEDPGCWSSYDAVLVARLPVGAWTAEALERAVAGPVEVLVEGPLPPKLKAALGVTAGSRSIEDGWLLLANDRLTGLVAGVHGIGAGGPVQRPVPRFVRRAPELDWARLPRVPITPLQASTWRAPGWEVELWQTDGRAEVLAEWIPWASRTTRTPAIVRRGSLTGCWASVLAYLGQAHTAPPFDGAEHLAMARITGVEVLLLALIDEMHSRAGRYRARVLPWPSGTRWVRSVRHDFDRALSIEDVRAVLDEHARVGSAATWYWRSEPRGHMERSPDPLAADLRPAALVAGTPGHEVALHTELLWSRAEEEQGIVETAIQGATHGSTAHGAANCFRYQGSPNVLWAEERGLLYTEMLGHAHLHLHRFAALSESGEIEPLRVVCLPQHVSFDRAMSDADTEAVMKALPLWIRARGFMQVMNHPDLNQQALFETLARMPDDQRADLTAAEAASWWRKAHTFEAVRIERLDADAFSISSRDGVDGLAVELLAPDGTATEHALSLEPGGAQQITPAAHQRL